MQSQKLVHDTDNRIYDYSSWQNENRQEYDYVLGLIEQGSKVIDLGCGNGSLMQRMIREKNCQAVGMEISETGIETCNNKGLNVLPGRIDEKLPFDKDSFDYSVCNVTMQMVMFPEILLNEMKRISRKQIISFPNFAFYKNRLELLFNGIMPESGLFGYKWHNTGHIHQFSIKDFYQLVETSGLTIEEHAFIRSGNVLKDYFMELMPNLLQLIPVFLLKKK